MNRIDVPTPMRSTRLLVLGILGASAFGFFACVDDDATSLAKTPTFEIALTIEGRGKVTGDEARVDCRGPGDCGTLYVFSNGVTLSATPAPGFRFEGWAFEGIVNSALKLDVAGRPGERRVVGARFVVGEDEWPECDVADAAVDASRAGGNCGELRCSGNTSCCLEAHLAHPSSKPPSCEFPARCPEPDRAACVRDADCTGTAEVCCVTVGGLRCITGSACTSPNGGRLCDEAHACGPDESCRVVNSAVDLRACVPSTVD